MKSEFAGSISVVREVEDAIRATKRYTKGAFSKLMSQPIQGADFPSRVLTEYYEVYPDLDVSWDMNAQDAWAWVWGDTTHIDVVFQYDYRSNKAKITVRGGESVVNELKKGIPNFGDTLAKVIMEVKDETEVQPVVGNNHRVRVSPTPNS